MLSHADIYFMFYRQNISAALLSARVLDGIFLDIFYSSLCDNLTVSLDTCLNCTGIVDLLVSSPIHKSYVILTSVLRSLAYYLYLFVSNFTMPLCKIYRNMFVHAVFVFCIPQEDPFSMVYIIFLSIKRNFLLRHDFLACVAAFDARRLILQNNVLHGLCSAQSHIDQLKLIYSLRNSLPHHISLPWLFILMQITSIVTYQYPIYRDFPSTHVTSSSSASPLFSESGASDGNGQYPCYEHVFTYGGGRQHEFLASEVKPYIIAGCAFDHDRDCTFKFVDHVTVDSLGQMHYQTTQNFIHTTIPLSSIIPYVSVRVALKIARLHHLQIGSHVPKSEICHIFEGHDCISSGCNHNVTVFTITDSKAVRRKKCVAEKKLDNEASLSPGLSGNSNTTTSTTFPPAPLNDDLSLKIISDFCASSSPSAIKEAGCAVCGRLVPVSQLTRLKAVKNFLHVLEVPGVTRVERFDKIKPIREFKGPVLDYACNRICDGCREQVRKGKVPHYALANGLWLGAVPDVLSCLTYIERLLISRVRVNSSFIRVASSGLRKMASHVIAFESPVPKVYHRLPPPVEDLDEVLAVLFTGPCKPTEEEFKRTPLLIRRKNVAHALEWLKLNHSDYIDLDMSYEELNRYPEDKPPVSIHFQHSLTNKVEEGTSVFDDAPDDGVEDGDCPFVVHGLTGEQLTAKSASALKGLTCSPTLEQSWWGTSHLT